MTPHTALDRKAGRDETGIRFRGSSNRLLTQQRVHASESNLRAMCDGSDTLFVLLQRCGTVIDCNGPMKGFVNGGYPIVGQLAWESFLCRHSSDETRRVLQMATAAAAAGKISRVQLLIGPDVGHTRGFDFKIYPVRDDSGSVDLVAYEGRESTTSPLLAKARSDSDRRRDEGLATLLHELRNPLAALRSAARILESDAAPPDIKSSAPQIIQRQIVRMSRLMEDVLDISGITQGKIQLTREYVTVASIVEAALECAGSLIDRKRHQLTIDMPDPRKKVCVDALRVSQIICNLLTNAAKYTDPKGRIDLTVRIDSGSMVMTVVDSGIGLNEAGIATIFAMFSQVEPGAFRSEGGLGIGLALVHALVELHGGTIGAFSDGLGHGSRFVVSLPVDTQDGGTVDDAGPAAEMAAQHFQAFMSRRILVVDDNEEAASSLAELLRIDGHEVVTAFTGKSARISAAVFHPEFALLDISLPDTSGYELARELNAAVWAKRLTLIAITGWGDAGDRRRALAAGFHSHLVKPINGDQLRGILAKPAEVTGHRGRRSPDGTPECSLLNGVNRQEIRKETAEGENSVQR